MDNSVKRPNGDSLSANELTSSSLPELVDFDLFVSQMTNTDITFSDLPTEHFFAENQYVRTMHAPRGSVIVGKKHRHSTLNVLLKGEMLVYTKESGKPIHLKAGDVFESGPKVRKVLVAIADSSFANIHVTTETDLEEIEKHFIYPESTEMLISDVKKIFKAGGAKCLGSQ